MSPAVIAFYVAASGADYYSSRPLPASSGYVVHEQNPFVRSVGLAPAKVLQTAGLVFLDSKLHKSWQKWVLRGVYGSAVAMAVRNNLGQRGRAK